MNKENHILDKHREEATKRIKEMIDRKYGIKKVEVNKVEFNKEKHILDKHTKEAIKKIKEFMDKKYEVKKIKELMDREEAIEKLEKIELIIRQAQYYGRSEWWIRAGMALDYAINELKRKEEENE